MKKLASLFLLLCATAGFAKGPVQELDVSNFSKGLDSYHDSTQLQDGYVQDTLNVYFDRQAPVEKRNGYTTLFSSKAYSYNTAWTYTDGNATTWLITRASDSIIASNLSGTIVKISTVSVNDNVDEVNAFGNAYFVDQTQGVYFWSGSATTYVAGSPRGSIITQFHNRVWVAGLATPNGNQLYASKFLDGTTWLIGLNPSDPAQFTIGLQDNFDNITAIYPFLDTLYAMKYTSIYALYGFDNTNFQNSIITRDCGCVDHGSLQPYNKGIVFMSLRGLEFYDGYSCNRISDAVKNKVDASIQIASFNQQSWVQQNTSDWQAGVFNSTNSLSVTVAAPGLTVSTGTFTDSTFSSGTLSNISTVPTGIQISTNNAGTVNDPGFENSTDPSPPFGTKLFSFDWSNPVVGGFLQWSPAKTETNTNGCNIAVTPHTGTWFAAGSAANATYADGATFQVNILDQNLNVLVTKNIPTSTQCSWVANSISSAGFIGRRIKLQFVGTCTGSGTCSTHTPVVLTTTSSYILGGDINFFYIMDGDGVSTHSPLMYIDDISNGSSTITTGSFTSGPIDTGLTTPVVSLFPTITSNTESIGFNLLTSATSGGIYSVVASSINQVTNRFIKYTSTFTVSSTDNALSILNSVNFAWAASSGTFVSQIHNLGNVNSFANFAVVDILNSGNIAFTICTSSSSNMTTPTCAVQPANSQILAPAASFIQFSSTFTTAISTVTPVLNAATVNWFSGFRIAPMASVVFDNRYWLSITTSTVDTANDAVLVMNINNAFSLFDIHAGGLVSIKNSLYHTDSNSTGNVYLDNQGFNDNGHAINAYITTRDFNLGSLVGDMLLDSIWPAAVNSGNYSLNLSYVLDKGSSRYSLATVNENEFSNNKYVRVPFPFSSSNPSVSQTVSFTIQNSDLGAPMQFEGMSLLYHERKPLE